LDLAEFTNRITRALQAPDLATQQEVIRLLIERIVVTDDALTVEHVVPTVNDSRLQLTCCSPCPTRPRISARVQPNWKACM